MAKGGREDAEILVSQLANYAYNMSPFNRHYGPGTGPLNWWKISMQSRDSTTHVALRKYYLKGVGDTTQQTHQPHIKISDHLPAPNIGIFAAPAVEDLLNSDEDFNAATSNPVNLDNTPEIEDGEPDSFTIIRQGLSFSIEHYIDFGGEAVARRYKGCNLPIATPLESISEVVSGTGNAMEWTPDDLFK
ncbi:hypothetical protein FS749_009742 [Ceratobasidium sp. UAMH 11750]|nr:hypothetical protein FS749_009742 [Ceratobasidium sp. UAMH 11750]